MKIFGYYFKWPFSFLSLLFTTSQCKYEWMFSSVRLCIYICMYSLYRDLLDVCIICIRVCLIKNYEGHSISFQTFFFVQAFKIVVHSWKFSTLLVYILWDDWPSFMISGSNEQLHRQLEYSLLKPNCHSWWI